MTRRSVCLAAALVAGLPPLMAQERTGERNLLVEGWLVELLDRNYQDAAKKYRETALEDQNPTVFRLVALGRIYEIGLIGDTGLDLDTLEQDLRTRRMSERPRSFARSDDPWPAAVRSSCQAAWRLDLDLLGWRRRPHRSAALWLRPGSGRRGDGWGYDRGGAILPRGIRLDS